MSVDCADEGGVGVTLPCNGVGVIKFEERERSGGTVTVEEEEEEARFVGVAIGLSVLSTNTLMGPELLFKCMQYLPFLCTKKKMPVGQNSQSLDSSSSIKTSSGRGGEQFLHCL